MTLGTVGRVLVEKHGDNILIVTPNDLNVLDPDLYKRVRKIVKSFTYWVQIAPGEWEIHRYEVASRFDRELGRVMGKGPKQIRFYAMRMIIELLLRERLSPEAQQELFDCCDDKILGGE